MSAPSVRWRLRARRIVLLTLVAGTVAVVTGLLQDMLQLNGTTPLEGVVFVLTVLLLVPLSLGFWVAVAGFLVELGGDVLAIDLHTEPEETLPTTAIIMPVRNEDPARIVAGLGATWSSLERTGRADAFELFVLSDTADPGRWLDEELAIARFAATLGPGKVHYRNRPENTGRKAGNIEDFCRRWGAAYRYMIVLDADSVLAGSTLVRLVELMEQHPDAGIIQVPPVPAGRRSLFGRLQQFAAAAYGPTWAAGLAWLQGGEGNYYGHNAIVRIAPFVEHCRLPVLPGHEPLGGSILSHDFVEAALMRRAGYRVHLATDLGGSYEEPPATLIDYTARDRRWCQGNLQHARLLGLPGLHAMSRAHLFMGVMAYACAPLWVLLLLVSSAEALRWQLAEHQYFTPGGSLFPVWEVSVEARALLLFALVLLLLFLPRGLALLSRLRERRRFGGTRRLLASGLAEAFVSMLLAPVMALAATGFVLSILAGRSSGWRATDRGDRGTSLGQAVRGHALTTVLGVLWTVLLARLAPVLLWWMLPVLAGMVLAIPLSMLSSHASAGRAARRAGLFLTPEELDPPPVLRDVQRRLRATDPGAPSDPRSALQRVLQDPATRAAHLRLTDPVGPLDPVERHRLDGLVLKARLRGAEALDDAEQRDVLRDRQALLELLDPAGLAAAPVLGPVAGPAVRPARQAN